MEVLTAVQIGQDAAQIPISGTVADKEYGTVAPGDRLGPDDRFDPGFSCALKEMGNAVHAVAIGKSHAPDAAGFRCQAEFFRVVQSPGR